MTEKKDSTDKELIIPDNPFPGLRPFRTDEAHFFFGRQKQSEDVLGKLMQNRFCAVTGASGSGKSSLIYCGVIPALLNNSSGITGKWITISSRPGNFPMGNLLKKLENATGTTFQDTNQKPEEFFLRLENLFKDNQTRLLIIIDQFEELFRFSGQESDRKNDSPHFFSSMLTELVKQDKLPVYLIITMRSDFVGECAQFLDLTKLINTSNYLVPRMTNDDFREVIKGPVNKVGASISENMVDRILEDLGDNPDNLPVLQHGLMRTWNYWSLHNDITRPISVSDYYAVGRLEKALSEHANEAYGELNEKEKEVCEKIFRTITENGPDNKGVRKPARVDKLIQITMEDPTDVMKVLDTFRAPGKSFITPSSDTQLTDETVVDISHESFMRIWDRLRAWVDEEASSVQMFKRLTESAFLYQAGRVGLWRPPDLQLALNWRRKNKPTPAWAERHSPAFERTMVFLEASERDFLREEENKLRLQKRQLARTRIFALVLGSAAIIALGLFIWTRELQVQAEKEFQRAETQRQLAELKTLEAQQQRENAEKSAKEADEQRRLAQDQSRIAEEQRIQAERMALEAQRQTAFANQSLSDANRQKTIALANEEEAKAQRSMAEIAREEAYQRRMLTTARSMAVKSMQATADPNLRILLAYQGYKFNEHFKGFTNDVDIYTGLYQALKTSLGLSYNVYNGHNDEVRSVHFIPGTNNFFSAGTEGRILKWDIDDPDKKYNVISEGRSAIESIRVSPNGKWLACAENKNGILLFNLDSLTQNPVVLKGLDGNIRAMVISPDSRSLFSTGLGNVIEYWDLGSGNSMKFAEPGTRVNTLSLSPDGVLLAGGTREGKLIIWMAKGETVSNVVYEDSANSIQRIAFAPDFRYIASGNMKGEILVFNADNFQLVRILSGHHARITDLAFSPDGKKMISASYDGNVLFWNMDDLTSPPIVLNDHTGFVYALAISSNGEFMVSGSSEGDRLISRPMSASHLAEKICKLVNRNLSDEEWNTYVGEDIPYEKTCKTIEGLSIDFKQ